jgi:hypothetical protein|tara:strand:+ start:941 stop:1234 length:294 start_codon:yes stop_codon:yes gene_type:complete
VDTRILLSVGDLVRIAGDHNYRYGVGVIIKQQISSPEFLALLLETEFPDHNPADFSFTADVLFDGENEVYLVLWQGPIGTGDPRPIWLFYNELEPAY